MSRRDLLNFLDWLTEQPFESQVLDLGLSHSSLLRTAEHLIVRDHELLVAELLGQAWTPPDAYHWIRYESANPAARLADAARRLNEEWQAAGAQPDNEEVSRSAAAHIEQHLAEMVEVARKRGCPC